MYMLLDLAATPGYVFVDVFPSYHSCTVFAEWFIRFTDGLARPTCRLAGALL